MHAQIDLGDQFFSNCIFRGSAVRALGTLVRRPPLFTPYSPTHRFGIVLGCVDKSTRTRFACKSIDIDALLRTRDGQNVIGLVRNEVTVMSHLAGHPNVRSNIFICMTIDIDTISVNSTLSCMHAARSTPFPNAMHPR